jgi:O-antigen ligase
MQALLVCLTPIVILLCLYKPERLWFFFPVISFFGNPLFGTRTLADVQTSKIPYGFLFAYFLIAATYALIQLRTRKPVLTDTPILIPTLLLLASGLISLFDTVDVYLGFKFLAGWACYVSFFYILYNSLLCKKRYDYFIAGTIFNVFILTLFMTYNALSQGFGQGLGIWEATWLSQNEIGFYFEPIIFTCFALLIFSPSRLPYKKTIITLSILLVYSIIISGTRGTWVALTFAALVFFIETSPKHKIKVGLILMLVILVFYLFFQYSEFVQRRVKTFQAFTAEGYEKTNVPRSSIDTRLYLMRVGKEIIANNLINGIGLGNYANFYAEYKLPVNDPALRSVLQKSHTPHNFFLRFGAETGLLGLAAAIFLLSRVVMDIRNEKDRKFKKPWGSLIMGCYLGIVANIAHCMLQERIFSFYFWAFLAYAYATLYHANTFRITKEPLSQTSSPKE